MGKEGQIVPTMTDEWINTISKRYIELYEKVIGEQFNPIDLTEKETVEAINQALDKLLK
jgi:phosphoribosylaminoimidazole-succinocarboxamide synthase